MSPRPQIEAEFHRLFGSLPSVIVTAPGRVNLIGEHTDYNDGFVFPAAIDRAVCIAAGPRNDDIFALYSSLMGARAEFRLSNLRHNTKLPWTNYACGVAHGLQKIGVKLGGANFAIESTVPLGAGLSSSAALEIASAHAFRALYPYEMPEIEIIKLCQDAENSFVGVPCGIMDQFVSALGKQDCALFLDCRSLDFAAVPIPRTLRIVICNTNVQRSLITSEYKLRREDCQTAVQRLAGILPDIRALRDVSLDDLEKHKHALDSVVYRRAKHVVSENGRVRDAVESLRKGDYASFGVQMYKSHFSLRDDFQVSCEELDAIVDICSTVEGVLGARMTGAGFGGCAICLVQEENVNDVVVALEAEYPRQTRLQPTIFVTTLENGVSVQKCY
jgi:galactokinase